MNVDSLKVESRIKLDKFIFRDYQKPVLDAIENAGYKKVLLNWSRRSGKDCTAFNIMIRAAIKKVGVYFYCLPTYNQGRKVIWDGILSDGSKFIDFIPPELVVAKNNQEMKLTLFNGSLIQIVGSDTASQSLVGTNPQAVVFSEWALADSTAYQFIRPALMYNDGWCIFVSTPRGRNHMYEMHQIALGSSDWFCSTKTVLDTGHISLGEIDKERQTMSEDMIQQEFFCSYSAGVEGAYYARYIDKMRLENRIGHVPWEPSYKVHTVWDLGISDPTVILFFQVCGQIVRIIDYYENIDKGLDHYARVLSEKPFTYGSHFAPHDIRVRELGSTGGLTRLESARRLGINFKVLQNLPLEDGIEATRVSMAKWWIDEHKCTPLLKSLEAYRREYDSKRQTYKDHPLHNWASHASDCARYLAISLPKTADSLSADALERRYQETMSPQGTLPSLFRDHDVNGF